MRGVLRTLGYITRHPLNRDAKLAAIGRYFSWQVRSRLARGPIVVPFVESTSLLVSPGMTGATGNVYCGLHEFEEMSFLLHALREGDLFIDVGANVGTYSILASGVVGATTIAIEPVPQTYTRLVENVGLNALHSRITPINVGVGAANFRMKFTATLDTVNHVVAATETPTDTIEVDVVPLDAVASVRKPSLVKIDVEGFETEVLNGASSILSDPTLFGVIMELNGSGSRYGYDETALHRRMLDFGFGSFRYEPFTRSLRPLADRSSSANTIYVRNEEHVSRRLADARRFSVHGRSL